MNKEDAKYKHCPHINQSCLSDECMMWEAEFGAERKTIPKDEPTPEGWTERGSFGKDKNLHRWVEKDTGTCGLITKACEL